MDKNLTEIYFSSRLSKQRQIKKNFSKVWGINEQYRCKNKFLKDVSLLEQSHKKKMTMKSDQCHLNHNTAVHNTAETMQTWLPCIMCTCSMHLLLIRHHVHFFCKAGKVVILNPVYSPRVTLLECGFRLPARKLFFLHAPQAADGPRHPYSLASVCHLDPDASSPSMLSSWPQ